MAALSLCQSLPAFYIVGCLVGLGFFGCSYAVVPVIVSEWFVEKNGFVMGLTAACGGIVAVILSLVFPAFIIQFGWSNGYVLLGGVVFALTTPVGLFLLRSKPSDVGLAPYGANATPAQSSNTDVSGLSFAQALRTPQLWVVALGFMVLAITVTVTQHLAAFFVSIG